MKAKLLGQLKRMFRYEYAPSINTYYVFLGRKRYEVKTRHKARKAVREAILNHGMKYYFKYTKRIKL